METRESKKKWQADPGQAFLGCRGRQADCGWPSATSDSDSPATHQEIPNENRVRCPRPSQRPGQQGLNPSLQARIRGSEQVTWSTDQLQVEVWFRRQDSDHGQRSRSPSPTTAVGRAAPSADPAVASKLDELGPVADSSAVGSSGRPGQAAPSSLRTQLGCGLLERFHDLDQTGPGGRGTSLGLSVSIGKGQKNRDHQRLNR